MGRGGVWPPPYLYHLLRRQGRAAAAPAAAPPGVLLLRLLLLRRRRRLLLLLQVLAGEDRSLPGPQHGLELGEHRLLGLRHGTQAGAHGQHPGGHEARQAGGWGAAARNGARPPRRKAAGEEVGGELGPAGGG